MMYFINFRVFFVKLLVYLSFFWRVIRIPEEKTRTPREHQETPREPHAKKTPRQETATPRKTQETTTPRDPREHH